MSGPAPLLVRVDNRLVHGQVLEAWAPTLEASALWIADDEAAGDALSRAAMGLAIPPGLTLEVLTLAQAAARLRPEGAGASGRTLLLVREIADAAALAALGVPIARLNLGNVHAREGRRRVASWLYLDEAELAALDALASAGTEVEARAIPSDASLGLPAIRAAWLTSPR